MSESDDRGLAYIRDVYEDSQRFATSLLKENERLRRQNTELQHELSVRTAMLNARSSAPPRTDEAESLKERLSFVEKENHRLQNEQLALQQQSASLLNLYVAAYRLNGTLDREAVLEALKEIIANMVGSEQLGIFEFDEDAGQLALIASVGIDAQAYQTVSLASGGIGHAARTGEIYLGGDAGHQESRLTACVPMTVSGKVSGVIAIFELLGQKAGLDSDDIELFNLLRTHAGMALYCSRLAEES